MHAKHADSDRLDDLSGRVIGCAFNILNTLGRRITGKERACISIFVRPPYRLRCKGNTRVDYPDVLVRTVR